MKQKRPQKVCAVKKSDDGIIDYTCGSASKGGRLRKNYSVNYIELMQEIDALTNEVAQLKKLIIDA